MKKISILFLTAVLAVSIFTSCGNSYKEKAVVLNNQADSLNYAFGYANGCAISDYYFSEVDNKDAAIKVFVDQIVKSYESEATDESTDQLYELGVQIGTWFRKQQEDGLLDKGSELKFDFKKVKEGLDDAINRGDNGEDGISIKDAEERIKEEMERISREKYEKEQKELEDSLEDSIQDTENESIN